MPVSLSVTVLGEARLLLSALRHNRRFSFLLPFASVSSQNEHPLVKEVKSLRDVVRIPVSTSADNKLSHIHGNGLLVPPDALLNALEPFLKVVRSRDASGIITGVALQSLNRIATRLILLAEQHNLLPQYATALGTIVDAAAACRFDATDPAADEVVLAGITKVISTISRSSALPLLSDAVILRSVEACLGIASGRRRASDLLKRTADSALADILKSIGYQLSSITSGSTLPTNVSDQSAIPSVFLDRGNGPAFGYTLNSEAFLQHGPASVAIVAALIQLFARMADPFYAQSDPEKSLGLELISELLCAAGSTLAENQVLKEFLIRDCCRAVLRSLGLYQSGPAIISSAFTVAIQLVHVLQEDSSPFVLALLESVYPFYISGYQNKLPKTSSDPDFSLKKDANAKAAGNGSVSPNGSNRNSKSSSVSIDPVIREIGLESLSALLSTPGLLCVVYRLADCDMKKVDVVHPLLKALGHASKTKRFRRRSKRLRASSSSSNSIADVSAGAESDDDDAFNGGSGMTAETTRFSRAAALLCAESVLAVIDTVSDRLKVEAAGLSTPPVMNADALAQGRKVRKEKICLQHAAEVFNSSEKLNKAAKLLVMLREQGLVEGTADSQGTVSEDLDEDVRAVVRFIRDTPGLNKEKKGVILGEPDTLSRRILADYTATFDFENRPFTESLRVFLESFRLPGESQKIDRIVQSFANRFYGQNQPGSEAKEVERGNLEVSPQIEGKEAEKAVIDNVRSGEASHLRANGLGQESQQKESRNHNVLKNADAAYVLSYSVVMLNTDQHNDSIRKKMSVDDFVRNCRGINDGTDLPRWFLQEVFDSIAAVEIRMSDEAGIGALTDLFWGEQTKLIRPKEGSLPSALNSRVFDEDLFNLSWEAGVVAANSILNEAGDANSVQKALEGFLSIARCATSFKISRPTDAVISSLCTATTIRNGPLYGAVVRFGTDIKAQMASVALSGVSRQCGDWLEADGWQALVAYLLRLHALCLLPVELEQRISAYGQELVGVKKEVLLPSKLIPGWWPSQVNMKRAANGDEKPKKAPRANGFFAAILAASIGSEIDSDNEDDDSHFYGSGTYRVRRKTSHTSPHYLRMRNREDSEAQDLARKCVAGCHIEDVIINEAKVLQSPALDFLSKAIAKSAFRVIDVARGDSKDDETAEEDEKHQEISDSILDWADIAPPSPRHDSSTIAGVSSRSGARLSSDPESDYPFALSPAWEGQVRDRDERKAREFIAAFCVDVLCELTLQNRDRLHIPWPSLHGVIVRIIAPATQPSAVLERAVVALLRVGVRLLHREEVRNDVLRGLNLLVRLPSGTGEALAVPVAAGIYNIVHSHGSVIHSTSGWHAILSILENTARYCPEAREIGLQTISCILRDYSSSGAVSPETYAPLLDAILAYTSCSSVDISICALDILYQLSQCIPSFSESCSSSGDRGRGNGVRIAEMSPIDSEMWSEYWGPLFLGFATSVRDARGKVRNSALGVLERVIASGNCVEFLSAAQWSQALSAVILPLMTQLFTTHGFLTATVEAERNAQKKLFAERNAAASGSRSRIRAFSASPEHDELLLRSVVAACNRTRMRAVVLISKTFLQHHMTIADGLTHDSFTGLWIGVLEVFRIAIESGKTSSAEMIGFITDKRGGESDELVEHVPESVKNLVLVMCDCGLLTSEQHVRWNATFDVVGKFVPDIEAIISTATQSPSAKENTSEVADAAVKPLPAEQEMDEVSKGEKVDVAKSETDAVATVVSTS